MADCNKQFIEYNENLNLTKSKSDKMNQAREASRDKIIAFFKEEHPGYIPTFWIQGSKKNGTNIRTEDDDCDQDDGIYFDRDPKDSVSGTILQGWIYDAVKDDTTEGAQWRKKCIRKLYKENHMGSYHFDYPAYYSTDKMMHPKLAVKNEELEESDAEEFCTWFDGKKDKAGQLVRIIKCQKGWCSYKSKYQGMPTGLAMTILVSRHIVFNAQRDDQCLYDTLQAIRSELQLNWVCKMPTTPQDDLFARYDDNFRVMFMKALDDFINDARKALLNESKRKASMLWKAHLGSKFPVPEEEEQKSTTIPGNQASLAALVRSNKPYNSGKKLLP
jgi:hypothetical protein